MSRTRSPASPARRRTVAIGLIGPTLDNGQGPRRWERWRPTVALGQHEDLAFDRIELLYDPRHQGLYEVLAADLRGVSPPTAVQGFEVAIRNPWDLEEVYGALHDFARAYPFEPEDEDYLVHITTGTHIAQICLFLLVEAGYFPGRLLQTSPPRRSLGPGPGAWSVIDLDLSRYDRLATRFTAEKAEARDVLKSGIATRNAAFNRTIERIEGVALATRDPILLTGPTGSGKSRLAERIHELKRSRRKLEGEFVAVNCATLRGDGAASALFGHAKGAFTGAVEARAGHLRRADKGVLFLDEIAELGLDEQAMLLRALEEKRFYPLGSDKLVASDFQLLAGTHRDLGAAVAAGRFREDLLSRIDLWTFALPGLAQRPEDVEPNLDYELEAIAAREGRRITMSREARERFLAFATGPRATWPGNFRDFDAAMRRMATLAPGGRIGLAEVDEEIGRLEGHWRRRREGPGAGTQGPIAPGGPGGLPPGPGAAPPDDLDALLTRPARTALDPFDRAQLAEVVRVCRGARTLSEAGRALFAASRARKASVNDADRLRKYLARFGLDFKALASRYPIR